MCRSFAHRAQDDLASLSSDPVYVTPENIETAIQWIHGLKRTAVVDRLSACSAIEKASKLSSVGAIIDVCELRSNTL